MGKCLKFLSAIEESGEELKGGKNHPGRLENIPCITKYVPQLFLSAILLIFVCV